MDLKNRDVLVIGLGLSGRAAIAMLERLEAKIHVYDGNASLDKSEVANELGVNENFIYLAEIPKEALEEITLAVISPGVPLDSREIQKIQNAQIPIWGEVELAYQYASGDILAITGTNGKTTTTALLGEICKAYNENTYVVGNIGNPYTAVALEMNEQSTVVAEMSSFQLETIDAFAPEVSAILNVTPDHLDRHHTMESYMEAKFNIAKNQNSHQVCVLNYEDEITRAFGEKLSRDSEIQIIYFSSQRKLASGIYIDEAQIIYNVNTQEVLCKLSELKMLGIHNYENIMAASAMALAYGIPLETVKEVVCNFAGVEHRIEYVCEKSGVQYFNDSKGTNPDAAIKGVEAMIRPTILIGGGYDKDGDYEDWIQSFDGKVKHLILTGQTKEKIKDAARRCGFENVILADNFEDAVYKSVSLANEGDAVLLSPACASWGEFENYEKRGEKFKEIINAL